MSAELSMNPDVRDKSENEAPDPIFAGVPERDEAIELRNTSFQLTRNPAVWLKSTVDGATHTYRRWRSLQTEIRKYPVESDRLWQNIESNLSDYRLCITRLSHKAERVDDQVWELYFQVKNERERLTIEGAQGFMVLKPVNTLEEMSGNWKKLQMSQTQLLRLVERAPTSLEFYDKMQLMRAERRAQREREEEDLSRINEARDSLISAIGNVRQLYDEERVAYSSKLLSMEDAERYWEERLKELEDEETMRSTSVEEVIYQINSLENLVRSAPNLVLRIREVEERLTHIISTHDLLLANGKSIIPQKEMVRISGKLYEQVPRMWASGQRAELEHTLETMESFLSSYENSVETELMFLERRRPGLTRALSAPMDDSNAILAQISAMARSLVNAIDARDRFMRGHSESVARLSVQIGQAMQWPQGELDYLYVAALLHDVGKISIPETILSKTTALNSEEWRIIQMHPYFSAQIIKPIDILARIVPWVYHHQERWDGAGYPNHLVKHEIPMGANIIALAEAYSVMICDLPYRPGRTKEEALEIVRQNSGVQFCPEVVEAFLSLDHS